MFLHIYFEIQFTINKIRQKLNVIKLSNNNNFTPKICSQKVMVRRDPSPDIVRGH